jgi:hypothetical protein
LCSCLFAAFATSLAIAWIVSLMYPGKPRSDAGGIIGA